MIASIVGLCLALALGGANPPSKPELLGTLDKGQLPEVSGIVKSRRHDGIFWIHNDSGNAPFLFAIRRDGSIVRRYKVALPNVDWEDIAIDDEGNLYLADIGNNGGRLPIRAIYQIREPDPSKPDDAPLKAARSWFYGFGDERFDAEGLIIDRGRAILVAKTFDGRNAELYSLSLDRPATLLRPTIPVKLGRLERFMVPATGADLSEDHERLAVCSTTRTLVYRRSDGDSWKLESEVTYPACGTEAVCWDGRDLILAGEDQRLSRISESALRSNAVKASRPRLPRKPPVPVPGL